MTDEAPHQANAVDGNSRCAADLALASRYSTPGPRYTSYPTAPQFRPDFDLDEYLAWLQSESGQAEAALAIYVHLPFCQDICYYCGCNKLVTRDKGAAASYLARLQPEIGLQSELVGRHRPVTQLHWGGGTPNFLDDAEITQLMHALASHFQLLDSDDREYAIELDPRTASADTIALLKGVGFNRISLGIQDFDPLVQRAINRVQPFREVARLVEAVRNHDFRSLGFDLIYGLPHQDQQGVAETLRKVLALRPDRVACYQYAHLPERFSSQRAIDRLDLPDSSERLRLQQLISHTLQEAGYIHIGMDHYVVPQDDLALALRQGTLQRNFQGYSLQLAEDLLGLGVSAISQMGDFYLQNDRELETYYQRLDRGELPVSRGLRLTGEDKLRRHVIMCLICRLRLDIPDCERRFHINFTEHFAGELEALAAMAADGLLALDNAAIEVQDRGRPFLRNICMIFDAHLGASPPPGGTQRFSATL